MSVEILQPGNRAAWLAARGKDVTASQIGALFDAHEYLSAFELWALKTGRISNESEETPAMQRGRLLEAVGVQLLRERHPRWKIKHNASTNTYYRDPDARIGATPDVIVTSAAKDRPGVGVIQIKSVEASVFKQKWKDEDGNIEPPLWIALQATLEAHLVGASWAAVAPLVVGHGLEMPEIDIPLIPRLIDAMRAKVSDFWRMVEAGKNPPPDFARDSAVIEAMYPGNDEVEIDLSADNRIPELLSRRAALKADAKAAGEELSAIDAEIKAKMGDAVVAHIGAGRRITWKVSKRGGFFVPESTIRTLKVPATKE